MRLSLARATLALTLGSVAASAPCWAKTPEACAVEYTANKDKIDGVQSRTQFEVACEAGQEVVPGPTSAAVPAVPPGTAAEQPATPASGAAKPAAR